jgi:hypothetical protein
MPVTLFGEIAGDCLVLRQFIPPERLEAYDRITELALRQAVLPEVEELRDERPLAEVIPLERRV